MDRSRACAPLFVATLLVAPSAVAQDAGGFVRRSALPTPPVLDVRVLRQQRVDIPSVAILSNPSQAAVLRLDLFADVSFRVVRERVEPTARGTWIGVVDGVPESTALFVLVGDELIGHIYTRFGFFHIERQSDGAYLAQQVDQSAFPDGPDRIQPPPDTAARPAAEDRWSGKADTGSVIDVLLIYTPAVVAAFGSEARALASIDLSVAETNQALRASRIPTQIRAVHTTMVDYAETGDYVNVDRVPLWDRVRELRDRYAADIAVFFLARAPGCGYSSQPSQAGARDSAYLAVYLDCRIAGGLFAQHFGRTLGAGYDWYVDGSFNGRQPEYAHGFVSLPGRFQDIMAAANLCTAARTACQRVLVYSNPAILHNGRPAGVPAGTNVSCTRGNINNPDCDADSARAIAEFAPTVARYRHSRTALSARQLLPGASFRSASTRYRLTYQVDGNLVLYDDRDGAILWATHTGGTSPGQAVLQTDGNFVVYDRDGTVHWTSETGGNPNAYLIVQDDGNLVIYNANDRAVWSSL